MTERQDLHIPLSLWETFLRSCGLRHAELERLRVGDITQDEDGQILLHVAESGESPARDVPVFNGFDWVIVAILSQRIPFDPEEAVSFQEAMRERLPDELLISFVPPDLDIEQGRREYAWLMYVGTIESLGIVHYPRTFNEVGEQVRLALGLPKIDEMIRGLMHRAKRNFMREFKASV